MTDDQIIHDVLDNLNQWDRDNRDTTMEIPFYIKGKFKLEERKCFDLTILMVNAGLVYRLRDNDYLIEDKGRKIADASDGWLGYNKTNYQRPIPLLDFLPIKSPQQYPTVTETKHEYVQKSSKLSISNIFNWIWKITDHGQDTEIKQLRDSLAIMKTSVEPLQQSKVQDSSLRQYPQQKYDSLKRSKN